MTTFVKILEKNESHNKQAVQRIDIEEHQQEHGERSP
jgi:hypothetical protein